jgi:hypothetical protein
LGHPTLTLCIQCAVCQLGNPWTDSYLDNKGALQWYLSHSIISEETFNLALSNCNLSTSYYLGQVGNTECKEAERQLNADLEEVVLENVYEAACNIENTTAPPTPSSNRALLFRVSKISVALYCVLDGAVLCISDKYSSKGCK